MTPLQQALQQAWEARAELHRATDVTSAYRLFDGRWEGAQGWTIDRYGEATLVQSFHREGADEALLEQVVDFVRDRMGVQTTVFLKERGVRIPERAIGRRIHGAGDDSIEVLEGGLKFGIDFASGPNTGLFLDARPLRAWVRDRSAGLRILNLFSYTGAFGVAAAAGGARSVTNVDVVPSAIERGRANFARNGLPSDSRTHLRAEVFDFLKRAAKSGQTWDAIISDPPPVPTAGKRGKKKRNRGFDPSADLSRLLQLVQERLSPSGAGWLLACSALRGTARFEEHLPQSALPAEPLSRGGDFPGPTNEGLRAWVIRPGDGLGSEEGLVPSGRTGSTIDPDAEG